MNVDVLVKLAINAADPVEKTAAPRTPVIMVTNAINRLTVVQRYLEIIAGIVDPSFLKDLNPEKKSLEVTVSPVSGCLNSVVTITEPG